MKTAISIDDELLSKADVAAQRLGVSRSRLFALAVGDYLKREREQETLAKLNEVYATGADPAQKRTLKGIKATVKRTVKERW